MRTIETKIYTIDEHPNQDKCFEWIRNNIYDLNECSVYEVVDSLKALQKVIGGDLDYSIGQSSARGEFITFKNYDEDLLKELNADECSLTGVCWDVDLIKSMQADGDAYGVLRALHEDSEYIYSDEGLKELCEANEYEFTEECP
tara:strand:+ start:339 stop:770 length:432 start_codon:yes stop_codon:yes gene_type:complete